MYKVILHPSKCPSELSWVRKRLEGEELELGDSHYNYHKNHGCMDKLEHYKMVTIKKEKCKCCGSTLLHRKKVKQIEM